MKNKSILFAISILFITEANSQKLTQAVISSQGDSNSTSFINLDWTLGESFIETISVSDRIFTQGLHQSFLSNKLSEEDTLYSSLISVYPNPVSTDLSIKLLNILDEPYQINITQANGILVKSYKLKFKDSLETISVLNLSSGLYFITISTEQKGILHNSKFIKY